MCVQLPYWGDIFHVSQRGSPSLSSDERAAWVNLYVNWLRTGENTEY